MVEQNLGGGAFGGSAEEGRAAGAVGGASANSRLNIDLQMVKGLNSELNKLSENTKKIKVNFKGLVAEAKALTGELNKVATAMGKVSGKGGSGYMDLSKGMPAAATASVGGVGEAERILKALGVSGGPGGAGGGAGTASKMRGGLFGKAQGMMGNPWVQAGLQAAEATIGAIDSRVDRNKAYALSADKLSVMLQQTTGRSQAQVISDMRQPLTKYRLGAGGISSLLSMEARTGLSAQGNAASIEALRTLGGFGYSASDITGMTESMASPDVANKMFMMTGTGIYGIGGKQKSSMQVIQDLTKRLGLNNEKLLEGSMQPGSVVRQRLAMAGVGSEMQDLVLQYAKSNVQFGKKGGAGMYDPSKMGDRKRMGIEGNYATQAEETERTGVQREENMYKDQASAYAQMEKNLQNVNKVLGQFEHALRDIIGLRTKTRGWRDLIKPAFGIVGGLAGAFAGGPMGAMAGYAAGSAVGEVLGDPSPRGATLRSFGSTRPTGKGDSDQLVSQLDPRLSGPLANMIAGAKDEGVNIWVNQGRRSTAEQSTGFYSRYKPISAEQYDPSKGDYHWNNKYWRRNEGVYPMLPPGHSMHEIGLAADMGGDLAWVTQNAAKYGVKNYAGGSIDEAHHVQPAGMDDNIQPNMKDTNTGGSAKTAGSSSATSQSGVQVNSSFGVQKASAGGAGSLSNYQSRLTLASSMTAFKKRAFGGAGAAGKMATLAVGNFVGVHDDASTTGTTGKVGVKPGQIPPGFKYRTTPSYGGWGYFTKQKWTDADLEALHNSETTSWNSTVVNSHGTLMGGFNMNQYNWDRGGGKRHAATPALATPEQQKSVTKNILEKFWADNGFQGLVEGTVSWPGIGRIKSIDLPPGTATSSLYPSGGNSGDPNYDQVMGGASAPRGGGRVAETGSNVVVKAGAQNTFNVNPTINITSTGSQSIDAHRLAKEVSKLLERELQLTVMRNS